MPDSGRCGVQRHPHDAEPARSAIASESDTRDGTRQLEWSRRHPATRPSKWVGALNVLAGAAASG